MKNSAQRMHLFPLYLVMLVALLGLPLSGQAAAQQAKASASSENPSAADLMFTARQQDGLHKAAILNNGFYVQHDYTKPWAQAQSLEDLTTGSDLVVLGTVQSARSELVKNGTSIETHYAIQVGQVLKGTQQGTVDVVQRGGKITFDDGTIAAVETPSLPILLTGHRYALFLRNVEGHFRRVGDAQGAFEIDQNANWVRPHANLSFDPLRKYSKLTPDQFIERVQTIVNQENR